MAEELKQAHDDLDALYVPCDQGGLKLSVSGRILLLSARCAADLLAERTGGDGISKLNHARAKIIDKQRAALESIAGWRNVNIAGEYEHGLRDIIRSMTDCAQAALEASSLTRPHLSTPEK